MIRPGTTTAVASRPEEEEEKKKKSSEAGAGGDESMEALVQAMQNDKKPRPRHYGFAHMKLRMLLRTGSAVWPMFRDAKSEADLNFLIAKAWEGDDVERLEPAGRRIEPAVADRLALDLRVVDLRDVVGRRPVPSSVPFSSEAGSAAQPTEAVDASANIEARVSQRVFLRRSRAIRKFLRLLDVRRVCRSIRPASILMAT